MSEPPTPATEKIVQAIIDKGGGAITKALTPARKLTLGERKAMTAQLVGSLENLEQLATTRRQYYGLLIATCFDVAASVGHGILIEDMFAPWTFFFPVPPEDAKPIERRREGGDNEMMWCLAVDAVAQLFYAIRQAGGQKASLADLQAVYEQEATDASFIASVNSTDSKYEFAMLVGVADGKSPQTLSYVRGRGFDPQIDLVPNAATREKVGDARLAALGN